jgi:hypothetical protein
MPVPGSVSKRFPNIQIQIDLEDHHCRQFFSLKAVPVLNRSHLGDGVSGTSEKRDKTGRRAGRSAAESRRRIKGVAGIWSAS